MDSNSCPEIRRPPGDWRDPSSVSLFQEFVAKNVSMPSDVGELIAYVLLLVVTWYVLMFALRFLLSLVKPVIVVVAALLLFRYINTMSIESVIDLIFNSLGLLGNLVANVFGKVVGWVL
ncbi:hypothetical protein KR009_001495 [Drosophila setifemur]|nr:hypothetical protein KR009_001495 [Drosophila setifemur]